MQSLYSLAFAASAPHVVVLLALQEKNSPEGLVGVARRFVKFGGGVGETQIDWLRQQLQVGQAAAMLVD